LKEIPFGNDRKEKQVLGCAKDDRKKGKGKSKSKGKGKSRSRSSAAPRMTERKARAKARAKAKARAIAQATDRAIAGHTSRRMRFPQGGGALY